MKPTSPVRPLPHTLVPLRNETVDSYLDRLAEVNHVPRRDLHDHVKDRDWIGAGERPLLKVVAALSGHPPDRLLRALPELRTTELTSHLPAPCQQLLDRGWTVQPACALCAATKAVITSARTWVPISTRICLRHRRWTDTDNRQLDIASLPEITRAQRLHHHLLRLHGWQAVTSAWHEAERWCWRWWERNRFRDARDQRIQLLSGPGWSLSRTDPRVLAGAYPDIVALTDLLATPELQSLPFTGRPADLHRFIAELRKRIAPSYRFEAAGLDDPLRHWLETENHFRGRAVDVTPEPSRTTTSTPEARRCPTCGQSLRGRRAPAVFCSSACRTRSWRETHRDHQIAATPREQLRRQCAACHVTWIEGEDNRPGTKYCSARCRTAAWRQRVQSSATTQDEKSTDTQG